MAFRRGNILPTAFSTGTVRRLTRSRKNPDETGNQIDLVLAVPCRVCAAGAVLLCGPRDVRLRGTVSFQCLPCENARILAWRGTVVCVDCRLRVRLAAAIG